MLSFNSVMNLSPWYWTKERTLYRVYTRELDRELCQDCLPYILLLDGLCELFLAYSK